MSVTKIFSYIKKLDIIKNYIYSDSGLLVYKNREEKEYAEDLAAWLPTLIRQTMTRLRETGPIMLAIKSNMKEILAYQYGDETIIVEPEKGTTSSLVKALSFEGPKCEVCGENLSLAIIKCPRCGVRLPFTIERCPRCGYRIDYRKCPRCGSTITVTGAKARLPRFFKPAATSEIIDESSQEEE